ncbi:MAG: undecaprenyl-phosphate glucose phosphotransferase [Xanthobacteraceae bacterium]|nr:undecaprenyl-phosphate glucose phosphotransferase [Xanthobacteraceae bacterium]
MKERERSMFNRAHFDERSVVAERPRPAPRHTEAVRPALPRTLLDGRRLPLTALSIEFLLVSLAVFEASALYHFLKFGDFVYPRFYALAALALTAAFVGSAAFARDYSVKRLLDRREQIRSIFWRWTIACSLFVCVLFLTQVTDFYSRGTILVQYAAGLTAAYFIRLLAAAFVASGLRSGHLADSNVIVIGDPALAHPLLRRLRGDRRGTRIAGFYPLGSPPPAAAMDPLLRDPAEVAKETTRILDAVNELARRVTIDDIVLCLPWSENERIRAFMEGLAVIPAATHLAPDHNWSWTRHPVLARIGTLHTIRLARAPLTLRDRVLKRSFDIAAASAMLVAAAPFFLAIAALVKLDSRGPAMFRQRRHGFKQTEFRVFKFRTMTTLDDGPVVRQATRNDARITRVGKHLRRLNLDEVPQLINVVLGQMSLVGPRPHALTHNDQYEEQIRLYARRHNVKPGITGWAQVNGLRGETRSVRDMQRRVEHDFYYIDNWSLFFDLKILLLTIFSPKTYRNAY